MENNREVIDVGNNILRLISDAKKELESARSWGMFDIFAGGFITSTIKQNKVGKAQNIMKEIDLNLIDFRKEIYDLNLDVMEITGIEKALDIFCDNIFVDLFIQGKIKENLFTLDNLEIKIKRIMAKLN